MAADALTSSELSSGDVSEVSIAGSSVLLDETDLIASLSLDISDGLNPVVMSRKFPDCSASLASTVKASFVTAGILVAKVSDVSSDASIHRSANFALIL